MEEKTDGLFTKANILIILFLFIFSSKLLNIITDICKSLIYLILIIYGLNYINPLLANKIKEIITDFINIDTNGYFIKESLSKLATGINSGLNIKSSSDVVNKNNDFKCNTNRNLSNTPDTNNRKLSP
jgi:hypothetical protein